MIPVAPSIFTIQPSEIIQEFPVLRTAGTAGLRAITVTNHNIDYSVIGMLPPL